MLDYYAQVWTHAGGLEATRDWFRLFMVPGMLHCRGGDAPNIFDFLPAIIAWVEKGEAPNGIVATQRDDKGGVTRTRPLYAYPEVAHCGGQGDVNDAANWQAKRPQIVGDDRIDWIWKPVE